MNKYKCWSKYEWKLGQKNELFDFLTVKVDLEWFVMDKMAVGSGDICIGSGIHPCMQK
jgi:hypothetical protein